MVRSILMPSILSTEKLNERMVCASSCYTHLSNIVSEHEVSSDGDVGRRLTWRSQVDVNVDWFGTIKKSRTVLA